MICSANYNKALKSITDLHRRLFYLTSSPIGSINDRIFLVTNWHVVNSFIVNVILTNSRLDSISYEVVKGSHSGIYRWWIRFSYRVNVILYLPILDSTVFLMKSLNEATLVYIVGEFGSLQLSSPALTIPTKCQAPLLPCWQIRGPPLSPWWHKQNMWLNISKGTSCRKTGFWFIGRQSQNISKYSPKVDSEILHTLESSILNL